MVVTSFLSRYPQMGPLCDFFGFVYKLLEGHVMVLVVVVTGFLVLTLKCDSFVISLAI